MQPRVEHWLELRGAQVLHAAIELLVRVVALALDTGRRSTRAVRATLVDRSHRCFQLGPLCVPVAADALLLCNRHRGARYKKIEKNTGSSKLE